ncbi:AbrB/MazE/SpoVT family DNA-binding domain-containing protein [Nesterenkonia muleiensis]|uniref:AbrB/MazE/SpoVT family DNA-binding domain-containing protein n=1 Tax=Nesterenkonia muleiensis TaxID=2282648 RepID=UPI000E76B75F|nr:AbrB/MazE/SpoVT family DNA-binding domain-containing protein [Nesterenkonia muleiensis]
MSTTNVTLGDRGRLVVPAEVRVRQRWETGTSLIFIDSDDGVVVMSREQARERIRQQLEGKDLVNELLADRRRDAQHENATA